MSTDGTRVAMTRSDDTGNHLNIFAVRYKTCSYR